MNTLPNAQSSPPRTSIKIEDSANDLAAYAADTFAGLASEAGKSGKPFRVALSGGSTPKLMYALLAGDQYRDKVPWQSIDFFFGDERWVPPTSDESNFKLADDNLFKPLNIDKSHVFPMPTENMEPQQAAAQYEATLREQFGQEKGTVRFDLIFLGMGEDGHTASLFPHTAALHAQHKLVVANWVDKLNTWRITLTAPVLQAATQVLFVVGGAGKAAALQQVLEGSYDPEQYPSQLLRHAQGHVTWSVDKAAGAILKRET